MDQATHMSLKFTPIYGVINKKWRKLIKKKIFFFIKNKKLFFFIQIMNKKIVLYFFKEPLNTLKRKVFKQNWYLELGSNFLLYDL